MNLIEKKFTDNTKNKFKVLFNPGDKVTYKNQQAIVLWCNDKFVDVEIIGVNRKIIKNINIVDVLPRSN